VVTTAVVVAAAAGAVVGAVSVFVDDFVAVLLADDVEAVAAD
jgi:hypothetical protein